MNTKNPEFKLSAVIACPVVLFCAGLLYLWSVFQQPVIDHYGWDVSVVTMISPSMFFIHVFASLAGGFILDRKSPRFSILIGSFFGFSGYFLTSLLSPDYPWLIFITYGVIAGTGSGFAYAGAINCIIKWFPNSRGSAAGLSVCAFGLSVLLLVPFIEWLIRSFGVPMTFRLMACLFPVITLIAGIFVRPPSKAYIDGLALPPNKALQRQYTPKETLRTPEFWFIAISSFFMPSAYLMMIPRIKTLAVARGLSEAQASLTTALTGVASASSRILCGALSDKIGRAQTLWGLAMLTLIASLSMIFADGWLYTISVLLIVSGYAGPAGIFPSICADLFGTKHAGANFGMCVVFVGFASVVFPMLSTIVDAGGAETGNYTNSFIVIAIGCLAPLVLLPIFDVSRKKRAARDFEAMKNSSQINT